MKDEYTEGAPLKTFISANGKDGFFSLYDEVFDQRSFDRIFVLFGGPGTGKSTFLRNVSREGARMGAAVEEIVCSSDPSSLDGVILEHGERRVGVLDGTPPHGRIITSPAVSEEFIDLGAFWDSERLSLHKKEILALSEKKKRAYLRAYALLGALGGLWEEGRLSLLPLFDAEKAKRQIKHKMSALKQRGTLKRRLLRAYSGAGETTLSIPEALAQNLLLVGGNPISAEIYLNHFAKIADELSVKGTVFLSPLDGKSVDAILLEESKTLLIKETLRGDTLRGRRIVADRFFTSRPEEGKEHRLLRESVCKMALSVLAEAKEAHAAMEEYYIDGMDFTALEEYRRTKTEEILSLLG